MPSLRLQLVSRTTSVVVVTLFVVALTLFWMMRASLLAEFDASLLAEARSVTSHVEQSDGDFNVELNVDAMPEFARVNQPHFYQIWTSEGATVSRSRSLFRTDLSLPESNSIIPVFTSVQLPTEVVGREVRFGFHPHPEGTDDSETPNFEESPASETPVLTIAVSRPTTELDQTLRTLRWLLIVVTTVASASAAAVMNGVIRHGLRSLENLAHSIERVGTSDLSERIQLKKCPREVVPVVQRLNELLARLDAALVREKTFSADVAHELRTPLAGLETTLEVCASRRREPEVYHDVVRQCLKVTQGMHAMVNNLLTLARADSNCLTVLSEPTDIAAFLDECWQPFAARADQRGLRVEWQIPAADPLPIDRELVRLILFNLFDNAVAYSKEDGLVRIVADPSDQVLSIVISNSGCELTADEVSHVFERFWRADKSRTENGSHCGLGLALCQRITEFLGGTITAQVRENQFSVSVQFSFEL